MSVHVSPIRTYILIFLALMAGTALTVLAAQVHVPEPFDDIVAMTIAVIKATLVVLFFMHVKYSTRLTKLVVVAGFFWLFLMFLFTFSDYLSRGWLGVAGK